jgi:hypothetical protein
MPLNPVFDLLLGRNAESNDDAYQTIALFCLTGMTRAMRGSGHSGGGHKFHQVADFTDDLLQPDDWVQRSKRPPYAFGLEWKY